MVEKIDTLDFPEEKNVDNPISSLLFDFFSPEKRCISPENTYGAGYGKKFETEEASWRGEGNTGFRYL